MRITEPQGLNISVTVSDEVDDFDQTEYVHVSGYYIDTSVEDENYPGALAIEFTPWNEWLSMEISEETLPKFNKLEIIARRLFEMTFVSFEEKLIRAEMDRMNESVEEIKNMTDEERKVGLTSLGDLLKNLQEEDENDEADSR